MANIFYSIVKTDCQEIESSLNENDILEFTIPNNCTDGELSRYFCSLGVKKLVEINRKQRETLSDFREKVKGMIDKCAEEFDLPFFIVPTLQTRVCLKT